MEAEKKMSNLNFPVAQPSSEFLLIKKLLRLIDKLFEVDSTGFYANDVEITKNIKALKKKYGV